MYAVDPKEHPVGIIILSHSPPKVIRFTIEKTFFKSAPNYDELPKRFPGEIDRWIDKGNNSKMKGLDFGRDQYLPASRPDPRPRVQDQAGAF